MLCHPYRTTRLSELPRRFQRQRWALTGPAFRRQPDPSPSRPLVAGVTEPSGIDLSEATLSAGVRRPTPSRGDRRRSDPRKLPQHLGEQLGRDRYRDSDSSEVIQGFSRFSFELSPQEDPLERDEDLPLWKAPGPTHERSERVNRDSTHTYYCKTKLVLDMSQNLWYDRASELITHYQKGPPMSFGQIPHINTQFSAEDLDFLLNVTETLREEFDIWVTRFAKYGKAIIAKRFKSLGLSISESLIEALPAETLTSVLLQNYIDALELHIAKIRSRPASSSVPALLVALAAATTPAEKRAIRAKLRRMGHTGGLR